MAAAVLIARCSLAPRRRRPPRPAPTRSLARTPAGHAALAVGRQLRRGTRPSRGSRTRSASTSADGQFKIQTPATSYKIDIYRMGYYGGDGARLSRQRHAEHRRCSQNQPACNTNTATGLGRLSQLGRLGELDGAHQPGVRRVLRAHLPDRRHLGREPDPVRGAQRRQPLRHHLQNLRRDLAGVQHWGGNSLYSGTRDTQTATASLDAGRAEQVSYDRPFATRFNTPYGQDYFFYAEFPMIEFLEENGYDISYTDGASVGRRHGRTLLSTAQGLHVKPAMTSTGHGPEVRQRHRRPQRRREPGLLHR